MNKEFEIVGYKLDHRVAKQLRSIKLSNNLPSCPLALRTSKKAAFTLAEVLITLGIIGVVAALTIPTVITNYRKAHIATSLAKAINTLETANQLILQNERVSSLSSLKGNPKYIPTVLGKNVALSAGGGGGWYVTKDGIAFRQYSSGWDNCSRNKDIYGGKCVDVEIDIDGFGVGQDRFGVDQFDVLVDNKGTVIPWGSVMYAQYIYYGGLDYVADTATWKYGCNGNDIRIPYYCTGNIVDHGYKVEYDL